ncbi:MAG: MerR family transcriptional regulator [bacterium]|nr:MerR family transcriptional regulator [bacterium]
MNSISKPISSDKNTDHPIYPIGTVARMLGISVMTLRMYERRGLIVVYKNSNGQRLYSETDINRLKCIRKAIVDQKISIEGIRTLHSLIPCWETIHCPMSERLRCPAYTHPQAGCWTVAHEDNVCADRDCRNCEVYQNSVDCHSIRNMIRNSKSSQKNHKPNDNQKRN